ncbi:MAG: FAD:protein FMN transferase [Lentisphaeraceae bacterium]|nr:FAD:protein FMN transferase [Lentisphaeraceae bacterium]
MGVEFRYVLYAESELEANKAVAKAVKRVEELNEKFSDYIVDSELWQLSASTKDGKPFKVSAEMLEVLQKAKEINTLSNGAFDVTAGPYFLLWRHARLKKMKPSARSMQRAANKVGTDKLLIDEGRQEVTLTASGMRIDLGGIAKGYAADEALKVLLESKSVKFALVDASGDIAMSTSPSGKWPVYLADNDKARKDFIEISQGAVATSGDTEQFVEIDGKRYSHIVNPRTGMGVTNRCRVTVIAADCQVADALASTVTVLGPEEGLELIESLSGVEAMIQQKDSNQIKEFKSSGFPELKSK